MALRTPLPVLAQPVTITGKLKPFVRTAPVPAINTPAKLDTLVKCVSWTNRTTEGVYTQLRSVPIPPLILGSIIDTNGKLL